jgi:acetoin utilization deacetylase AcuC-like enzyme
MLIHSPRYNTPLREFGIDKPFALDRGTLVLNKLKDEYGERIVAVEPEPIQLQDALLVHSEVYLETLREPKTWHDIFELKPDEYDAAAATRPLNELYDDVAFKSGGTKLAVEMALAGGLAANLGGGYHHAFPDRGHGFCALNDVAIAIRAAQRAGKCKRVMIVDVDFHQGDGTARIFADDQTVFTLSIHSEEGWPEQKQHSDLDIGVLSSEQHTYNERLAEGIEQGLKKFAPDMVLFVAGSDAYELDVLPGTAFIKLPLDVIKKRDEMVIDRFADAGIPLAMVFAGGYGPHVWEVHYHATRRLVQRAFS